MKNIYATLLIIASIGIFYAILLPAYGDIQTAQAEKSQYEKALNDSQAVEERQAVLETAYNNMAPSDVARLEKMLPDSIDNIRLIIEINNIAERYNMTLKNPKVSEQKEDSAASIQEAITAAGGLSSLYGVGLMSFTVTGTYETYIAFIKDLEKSLRLVDITAISLSPGTSPQADTVSKYDFNTTIKTYWLK